MGGYHSLGRDLNCLKSEESKLSTSVHTLIAQFPDYGCDVTDSLTLLPHDFLVTVNCALEL